MASRSCLSVLAAVVSSCAICAQTPPTITSLSPNQTVVERSGTTLSLVAAGAAPLNYQWRKDGAPLSGATQSTLAIASVQVGEVGVYSAVVSNPAGSVTSRDIHVSMTPAPVVYISEHPASRTVWLGDSLTLQVSAAGVSPLSYQWHKNGTAIAGATKQGHQVTTSAALGDSGTYTVTVVGGGGSVTSEPCQVEVATNQPPTVEISSASSVVMMEGEKITLTSVVSSPGPVVYQWSKDGVTISGATRPAFEKINATVADSGAYSLTVSTPGGSATGASSSVYVKPASTPVIRAHPASMAVPVGDAVTGLIVAVDGTSAIERPNSVSYQWLKNGAAIAGATNRHYYIAAAQVSDAGTYAVAVRNAVGTTTSQDAVVTVDSTGARSLILKVTSGSEMGVDLGGGQTFTGSFGGVVGNGAQFQVHTSTDLLTNSYQWKKDGIPLAGATFLTYATGTGLTAAGSYTVDVTNGGRTATSRPITFDLIYRNVAPRVILQPVSSAKTIGEAVQLFVSAIGEEPLAYQWKKDGAAIAGATSASYSFQLSSTAGAGTYAVAVSNRVGTVTSAPATVSVALAPVPTRPPVIGRHPASITWPDGSFSVYSPSLSVEVIAGTPVTYQWRRDGVAIAAAKGPSIEIRGWKLGTVTPGSYSVEVSNAAGSTTSHTANVVAPSTVLPSFSGGVSLSLFPGGSTVFDPRAVGGTSFQWRKNGADIRGATTATLSLSNVQAADVGTYTLIATNSAGTVSSSPMRLTLWDAGGLVISAQPVSRTVNVGETVTFQVVVAGANSGLKYNWLRNGSRVSRDDTSNSLTLTNVQPSHAGVYTCSVASNMDFVVSEGAELIVVSPTPPSAPVFTAQPIAITAIPGQTVAFSSVATGNPTPSYQWKKNGITIAGAIAPSFLIGTVQAADAGSYTVVATNLVGSVSSNAAVLTVDGSTGGGPVITSQPVNQAVLVGQAASFTVVAAGTSPLAYQWQKNGVSIAGASGARHSIAAAQASDAGSYRVIVSNAAGAITSDTANLVVNTPAPAAIDEGRLTNLSVLAALSDGETLTMGTVIGGAGTAGMKNLLARAAGPSLSQFGISAVLPSPAMTLNDSGVSPARVVSTNRGWGGVAALSNAFAQVGAFPYASATSADAALYQPSLAPGNYTIQVSELNGRAGMVIAELYDATPATQFTRSTPRLINVSVLKPLAAGVPLTIGFVVGGTTPRQILLRAVGPTLGTPPFNITDAIARPQLALSRAGGVELLRTNSGWGGGFTLASVFTKVGAFPLAAASLDAALLVTASAGNYTAQASAANNGSGIVLVEIYEVP